MASESPKLLKEHTRRSFVRSSVEENDATKKIIDAIHPYFPKSCLVIGGWVDTSKQYWKVNFHWEYLLLFMDKALGMDSSDKHSRSVKAIRSLLKSNSPSPEKGYVASKVMGKPADGTGRDKILLRWKTVRQCKKDFKSVMSSANLLDGMTVKKKKAWYLAVAPVASPGKSKHGAGHALDIYGDNRRIKEISRQLGATLVFDEASHVHVEFAKGVAALGMSAATLPVLQLTPGYSENEMCWMSPREMAEVQNDVRNAPVCEAFEDVSHPEMMQCLYDDPLDPERLWGGRP